MSHLSIPRVISLAHQFRLGESVAATQILPTLLQDILTTRGGLPSELVAAILQCQEWQDWLGLADYLEYELVQTLNSTDLR